MSWNRDADEEGVYATPSGEACPHLGWQDDAETHYAYPNIANYCHAGKHPEPIDLLHQSATCLGGDWAACPRYHSPARAHQYPVLEPLAPAKTEEEPAPRRSLRRLLIAVALVVALAGLVAVLVIFWPGMGIPDLGLPIATDRTPAYSPTLPATATATTQPTPATTVEMPVLPTETATATRGAPSATATVEQMPSPTPSPSPTLSSTPTASPSPSSTPTPSPTSTATPTPTQSPSPTPKPTPAGPWRVVHVVQAGETLATIAARYGSSVDEIVTATGLENPDLIYRGQVLTVPLPSAGAAQEAEPILTGAKEDPNGVESYPLAAPELLAPVEGEAASGTVTFRWRWDGKLEAGQYYALLLWRGDLPGPCCLFFTVDRQYRLVSEGHPTDTYRWEVRVIDGGQDGALRILDRFLSPPGEPQSFAWTSQ